MEAYYHSQANMPHFSGHYRQRGKGFGALAIGIGRVALPLARKFIVPAAKRIGKELLVQAAPEIIDIATRKKTPQTSLEKHSKNTIKRQNWKNWSWTQQVPYEQKTEDSNTNNNNNNNNNNNHKKKKNKNFNFSPKYEMISNLLPTEATHSSLDLFEKPPLLVTF